MNKKGLAILLRTRMRPTDPTNLPYSPNSLNNVVNQNLSNSEENRSNGRVVVRYVPEQGRSNPNAYSNNSERDFEHVRESMHSAISMNKTEVLDSVLNDFSEGYFSLSYENRRRLLLVLAKEYDLNRTQVRDLIKQYLGLELPTTRGDNAQSGGLEEEAMLSAFYRTERNLRLALKPMYEVLFERLNTHPGGLKFLSILRAIFCPLSPIIKDNIYLRTLHPSSNNREENFASLRALDSYLKEKLSSWLSPAALELHHITWDDPASLLEKIVAFEAVHPISNLIDLKRRLGVGRRCFGYFHSSIPGEPLIFIEVALMKNIAQTIQEVLWDDPPIPEREATCALFYSISSTQPGLSGINLGKFLIKRVITLVKRDMPHISAFATLSPIPGYMQWLLSKLASQLKLAEGEEPAFSSADSGSTFWENILEHEEESELMEASSGVVAGNNGMEVMFKLLTSTNYEWTNSPKLLSVLKTPLMRLCARYLLQEKMRGKALDSVANFHLQNGAMIERINWMADRSEKGLRQSGGIMVNYVYRVESIEEYSHSYFSTGQIHASSDLRHLVELKAEPERQ